MHPGLLAELEGWSTHGRVALAERGNALLKNPFTMLRHVTIGPSRTGATTAAALVILHVEHHRTA